MLNVEDKLSDHEYDGIQEYDNPMPRWWVYLFLISIIWAGLYFYYYHIGGMGPGSEQEYISETAEYKEKFAAILAAEANINWEEPDFEAVADAASINSAKALFLKNCASCHNKDGGGGIGPNLTDEYWIHGGSFNNIVSIIALGVAEKGMIPWKTSLKKDDIIALASYIQTLSGTNPPNAKAPQGDIYSE